MNTINADNSLILIIDVQEKLLNMVKDLNVQKNAEIIAKAARTLNIPVIITEQYPKGLGNTIQEIKNALPNAIYVEKTHFSAYKEEAFAEILRNQHKKQIIIFGIETHICVLQTAFELINNGYEVFVAQDACASRTEHNNSAALKRLLHAGAQIVTTEMVIFELLQSSKNPNFKELQSLIK